MRCQRCQGYMVSDHFMDLLNVKGELDCNGWRCLNCGGRHRPRHCAPSPVSTERSCEIKAALVGSQDHAIRFVKKQMTRYRPSRRTITRPGLAGR